MRPRLRDPAEPRFMHQVPLADLNDKQKGFVSSVRHLEATEAAQGDGLLRIFADMFPPADLFSKELCELPAVYTELRNFLDSHGANMQQHSSRRIMMTLAHKYTKSRKINKLRLASSPRSWLQVVE